MTIDGDDLRPYMPLAEVVPYFVIDFLRGNPEDCMCYYPGQDRETGKETLTLFVKMRESDAPWYINNPVILAELSLVERTNDPVIGHGVFARAVFFEGQTIDFGDGVTTVTSPASYITETEFPVDSRACMQVLETLIQQAKWSFTFVSNDCETFYNAKSFDNPLHETTEKWLYRVRKLQRQATGE